MSGHGTVLVDDQRMTLYHLGAETAGGIGSLTCTGPCTRTWHPLLLPPGDLKPAPGPGVPNRLGLVLRPGGREQVTYNNQPLYTYAGDSRPGQDRGQGRDGGWSVVPVPRPPGRSGHAGG